MTTPEIRAKALELTIAALALAEPAGVAKHPAARVDDVLMTVPYVEQYLTTGEYKRQGIGGILALCPGGELHNKPI